VTAYFPYARLGLRGNPFQALTNEALAQVAEVPPELAAGHWQVLGEQGAGKTTLLVALAHHARAQGQSAAYEYLPEGAAAFTTPLAGLALFCLDEAQRLRPGESRRLRAGLAAWPGLRLVVASHADVAPGLAPGRMGTLRLGPAEPELLARLIERRLAFFALPGGALTGLTPEAVGYVHTASGGNLRRAEQGLYEVFAAGPPLGWIEVDYVRSVWP
jgi:hypothetical protein